MFNLRFFDFHYIHVHEDKNDIKIIDNIYLSDDDLNEDGKY